MILPRWTIGCVALVGFAAGCSDEPAPSPRLYPILNDRGFITYTDVEPQAQPIPTGTRVRVPVVVAESETDRQGEPTARHPAELQRRKEEWARQDREARQEREARQAREEAAHKSELENLIWERQQARAALNSQAGRLPVRRRGSSTIDQSGAIQDRATSLYLDRERVRLRQEERSLRPESAGYSDLDNRPTPLTIP